MERRYPKPSGRGKQRGREARGGDRRTRRQGPRRIARQAQAQAESVQLPLSVEGLVELARESLSTFAVEVGLKLAECLLEDEVTRRCGPRYARPDDRRETRYGHQRGFATLAGQKAPLRKPRVRSTEGRGEVELENYALLQSPEAMPEATLRRMIHGVSCRRYEQVVDLAREAFGVQKSSVSRGFVRGERRRGAAARRAAVR